MKQQEIIAWLRYWQAAKAVAVDQIRAFDQVYQARKYCEVMRVGVFCEDLVSDLQIWNAIKTMRAENDAVFEEINARRERLRNNLTA